MADTATNASLKNPILSVKIPLYSYVVKIMLLKSRCLKDEDKYIKRHFYVSGTSIRINSYFIKDNNNFQVIDYAPESIITDPENVSDFGKEIYNAMKAQPFNNPILLSFTVDKNI